MDNFGSLRAEQLANHLDTDELLDGQIEDAERMFVERTHETGLIPAFVEDDSFNIFSKEWLLKDYNIEALEILIKDEAMNEVEANQFFDAYLELSKKIKEQGNYC